jgi:hypothetical protein
MFTEEYSKDEHISLWNTMVKVSSGLRLLKMKRRPSELQNVFFFASNTWFRDWRCLMDKCLQTAKEFGFEQCYLETMLYA